MELSTIEREIYIEASPEVVFEVVSSPNHVERWWPDEAHYEAVPGSSGEIVFGDRDAGGAVASLTIIDVQPPRSFSFRWTHPSGESAVEGNSLLVTFELTPSGAGTLLKMTESGFREMGWEVAVLEEPVPRARHRLGVLPAAVAVLRGGPRGAVMSMAIADTIDDDLWSAIGDPTRRRILDLLLNDGHGTATSLSEQLPMTRQAITKHLVVLDRVVLVRGTQAGRETALSS